MGNTKQDFFNKFNAKIKPFKQPFRSQLNTRSKSCYRLYQLKTRCYNQHHITIHFFLSKLAGKDQTSVTFFFWLNCMIRKNKMPKIAMISGFMAVYWNFSRNCRKLLSSVWHYRSVFTFPGLEVFQNLETHFW